MQVDDLPEIVQAMDDAGKPTTRRWKSRRAAGDAIRVTTTKGEELTIEVLSVWNGKVSLALVMPDGTRVSATEMGGSRVG